MRENRPRLQALPGSSKISEPELLNLSRERVAPHSELLRCLHLAAVRKVKCRAKHRALKIAGKFRYYFRSSSSQCRADFVFERRCPLALGTALYGILCRLTPQKLVR